MLYSNLFHPDSVAAMLDAWFLIAQIRGYFENRKAGFDPVDHVLAVRILNEMESNLRIIIENSGPDISHE